MAFPSPAWKRVVNKQFSGKGVCSLQRCSGNLTLNNTDISFPTGGNSFIILKRSPVCARLFYSPGLWAGLPLSFLHFSNWGGRAGRAGGCFFFFSPLSLPCGVLNCLPADVIQPLRNSFCMARLNDSSHSQRFGVRLEAGDATEMTFTGKAVGPAKCGELFSLADFLAPQRRVFSCGLPEMELPWQLSGVTELRGHFLFLSFYLSPFRVLETFKPVITDLQKKARSSGAFTVLVSLVTRWRIDSKFSSSLGNANRKKTVTSEQPSAGVNSAWKRKELCLRSSPMFWTRGRSWTPGTLDFFKQPPLEMEYI